VKPVHRDNTRKEHEIMASSREHNIVESLQALIARVEAMPDSADKARVAAAVEDPRVKLGAVGYPV
jgi:hypothetical protein